MVRTERVNGRGAHLRQRCLGLRKLSVRLLHPTGSLHRFRGSGRRGESWRLVESVVGFGRYRRAASIKHFARLVSAYLCALR